MRPPPSRSSGSACRRKHQTGISCYWMMLRRMKVITNLTFIIHSPVNEKTLITSRFFFFFKEHKLGFLFIPNSCICCNLIQSCDLTQSDVYNLLIYHWSTLRGCTGGLAHILYARRGGGKPLTFYWQFLYWVSPCGSIPSSTVEKWRPQHLRGAHRARQNSIWVERGAANLIISKAQNKSAFNALFQSKP